jgi:hypothetical protein
MKTKFLNFLLSEGCGRKKDPNAVTYIAHAC